MIDLTPLDVRKKKGDFRPKLRGYDPEEVDTFLELVADRFEELVKENLALAERVERFGSQLEALEGRESAIQEALVSAQKIREEVGDQTRRDAELLREQARRESVILKAEAETEISRRLGEAEGLMKERQWALDELERNRRKFLKAFRSLLEREFEALEVEEGRRPLEETPLDLNLRGWTPSDEGAPEEEIGGREAAADEGERPGGFETQRLEVPIPADLDGGEESEPAAGPGTAAVPEAESGPEPEPEATAELGEESAPELGPESGELPPTDAPAPDFETPGFEKVSAFPSEPAFREDASQPGGEEFGEAMEEEESGADLGKQGPELAPEEGVEAGTQGSVQEPKWLFSLLKRDDGDGPEGESPENEPPEKV